MIQLKGKEILVTCSKESQHGISFWNINTYINEYTIKGYGVDRSNCLTELTNDNIALSSNNKGYPIVIINCISYEIKKIIKLGYRLISSSLCLLNQDSFIFADGRLLQISNNDFSVIFESPSGGCNGMRGMVIVDEGKHFVVPNYDGGLLILKLFYY